jgi:hypothetical protein
MPSVFVVDRNDTITEVKCVKRTAQTYTVLDAKEKPQLRHRQTWSTRAFDTHGEAVRYVITRAEEACARSEAELNKHRTRLRELKERYTGRIHHA